MSKTKLIPKHKTGYFLDYDPTNPYHFHTEQGEKVVIEPEQYEKHKDEPYFANIRKQVEEHQAAYPGPEYEINPSFVESLKSTYGNHGNVMRGPTDSYQVNYINSQLPKGYHITSEGPIIGPDGTPYVQQGFKDSPKFKVDKNGTPISYSINKGKPVERTYTYYPVITEKALKQSLSVDRTYDVDKAYKKAYKDYMVNNSGTIYNVWAQTSWGSVADGNPETQYTNNAKGSIEYYDLQGNPHIKEFTYDGSDKYGFGKTARTLHSKIPFINKTFRNKEDAEKFKQYLEYNSNNAVYPEKWFIESTYNKNPKNILYPQILEKFFIPSDDEVKNSIMLGTDLYANGGNLFYKGGLIQKHQRGQKITQKNPEYDFTVDFRKYIHNHNYPEYERSNEDKKRFNQLALKQYVSNQLKKYSDNIKNVAPDYYYSEYLPYLKSLKDSTVVSEIPVWSAKANGYELSNLNDLISYIKNGYGTGGIEMRGFNDYIKSLENTYGKYEKTPANPQYRKYLINKNKDKNNLYEASQFVLDYYSSPGYKERATKYNIERTPLLPYRKVKVLNAEPGEGSNAHTYRDYIRLDEDDTKYFTYPYIISHELGHFNPLYNTRSKVKTDDSPYSNNDYSDIPSKYKDILSGHDYENDHDAELSENYSDLMGLRESLFRLGIFDSKKSGNVFTLKMLNEYRKTKEGEKNRFLKHHTDQQIIDAVNEIAYNDNNIKNINLA